MTSTRDRDRCVPVARAVALAFGAWVCLVATAPWVQADEPEAYECVVMPHSVLDLSSGVSGRLDAVHVDRAERVSAGQVLAELESQVERATFRLARARAGMDSEVSLRKARLEYDARRQERMDNLSLNRVASAQEVDDAKRDAVLAGWQVRVAKDNLRLAALEAERASASLALREVLSPFDGVVVERFKSPGEYVDEEPIVRVARLDPLRVEVIVPIAHYARFAPGLSVRVFPETESDATWDARVTAVDAVADPASGTFRARLELPNPEGRLLAGIKCRAALDTGSSPAADGVVERQPIVPLWYAPGVVHPARAVPVTPITATDARVKMEGAMLLPVTPAAIAPALPEFTGNDGPRLEPAGDPTDNDHPAVPQYRADADSAG